jgi:hypothetical protein
MAVTEEKNAAANELLEWFGILGAPVAWLTQFLANYALVRWACIGHGKLALHLVSALFLAVAISAGVVSARYFSKTRQHSASGEEVSARPHFMATLGILSASLYSLAIIVQAIPSFILDPCQK